MRDYHPAIPEEVWFSYNNYIKKTIKCLYPVNKPFGTVHPIFIPQGV